MEEKTYSLNELERAREEASLIGVITQKLDSLFLEVKEMRREFTEIRNKLDNVVTREEMKKELEVYVTKESIQPLLAAFNSGVKYTGRIFILLIIGIIVLLGVIFGKNFSII